MIGTRPDIAFAVTALSKHAANPSQDHLNKALYIGYYLYGTQSTYIKYDGSTDKGITVCTDLDWGSDPTSHKSVMGYFLKLTNGIFSWTLCTQKTVALFSTEAEYMVLSDCSCQIVWFKTLLQKISFNLNAIPICGDNQGSIFIVSNPVTEKRSEHIDI